MFTSNFPPLLTVVTMSWRKRNGGLFSNLSVSCGRWMYLPSFCCVLAMMDASISFVMVSWRPASRRPNDRPERVSRNFCGWLDRFCPERVQRKRDTCGFGVARWRHKLEWFVMIGRRPGVAKVTLVGRRRRPRRLRSRPWYRSMTSSWWHNWSPDDVD